jgi:hypothetical protein
VHRRKDRRIASRKVKEYTTGPAAAKSRQTTTVIKRAASILVAVAVAAGAAKVDGTGKHLMPGGSDVGS